jgi:hypothetical protein
LGDGQPTHAEDDEGRNRGEAEKFATAQTVQPPRSNASIGHQPGR